MMTRDVPPVLQRLLDAELAPGERVVWSAIPSIWRCWTFHLVNFLVCIAIFLEWKIWSLARRLPSIFTSHQLAVVDSVLILTAILTVCLPALLWWLLGRILYVVTDRRAVIIRATFIRQIQSFTGEQLIRIIRRENSRGNGDIIFQGLVGFWGIADTRGVSQILRQAYENTLKK